MTIIKLVSKDTVDEDIYAMQQRKSKMNAAIMGSDAEWKKHSKDEKKLMLQTAVDRFLMSPKVKSNESIKSGLAKENCENVDDSGEGTSEYL